MFCSVDEVLIEDEEVEDGEVDDGDVLDGYCELLCAAEDDGVDDVLWSDEEVCANAPQHMPVAQRSVMILVP